MYLVHDTSIPYLRLTTKPEKYIIERVENWIDLWQIACKEREKHKHKKEI